LHLLDLTVIIIQNTLFALVAGIQVFNSTVFNVASFYLLLQGCW